MQPPAPTEVIGMMGFVDLSEQALETVQDSARHRSIREGFAGPNPPAILVDGRVGDAPPQADDDEFGRAHAFPDTDGIAERRKLIFCKHVQYVAAMFGDVCECLLLVFIDGRAPQCAGVGWNIGRLTAWQSQSLNTARPLLATITPRSSTRARKAPPCQPSVRMVSPGKTGAVKRRCISPKRAGS